MKRSVFLLSMAFACALAHAATVPTKQPPVRVAPFAGTMTLDVTATDVDRQIIEIRESIPVQRPGKLTLLYPQWEVGSHAPTASAAELAGLTMQAGGQPLAWKRDPLAPHVFHVDVPRGARTVELRMQFLGPAKPALLRPDFVSLPWHRLLLYPQGWPVTSIPVQASVALPPGLALAGPLDVADTQGGRIVLKPMSLAALVDAPAYAARHRRVVDLSASGGKPVLLDMVADDAASLAVPEEEVARMRALVRETGHVFGAPPFRRHHLLAILDDATAGGGIEHLEESENLLPANYFTALERQLPMRDLIAHEYVHAWNGRYRIPADLWASDYNTPVAGSLLWVYEGQTELWGRILAARAGQRSVQQTLDRLALDAALVAGRRARAWKTLADSTVDPLHMVGHPVNWRDWQRREDYYPEGALLWLDVEARLREKSGGVLGLDDFARRFFDTQRQAAPALYDMNDIVRTLDGLAAGDWRAFLARHLDTHDDADAMAGLGRMGWQLVFRDVASDSWRQEEEADGAHNLDHSIGLRVRANGTLRAVSWEGPAFAAGLAPGAKILAVNGAPFSVERLEQGVKGAAGEALRLDVEVQGRKRSVTLDYRGTLRYPWLEPVPGARDLLTPLLAPRVKG